MKAITLCFVVKGENQFELINIALIARIVKINGVPYIGMAGQNFTRQITSNSYMELLDTIEHI